MGPPLGSYSLYKMGWEFYPFFGDRLPFLCPALKGYIIPELFSQKNKGN
jgi:hypothetical protein